jgi:hypothetical protein
MKLSDIVIIEKRSNFPKCVRRFKKLKGICIGCCIDKESVDGDYPGAIAHSHNDPLGFRFGWICLSKKWILENDGILLHEIAHLLVNDGRKGVRLHGKEFKKVCKEIGATIK